MTQATYERLDRWAGGTCPFEVGWRKVMMWLFIITDGLLFAGFLASYGYARVLSPDWPDQGEMFYLPLIALMTFVLISSSASMAISVGAARGGALEVAARYVSLTIAGGAAFLGIQVYEWTHLIHEGARLTTNPWGAAAFGSYFFLITGFHGTHVLTGLLVLLTLRIRLKRGVATADGVEVAGLYWHFVDLVWVFIFTCFYLL